jgi:hypothetical protein
LETGLKSKLFLAAINEFPLARYLQPPACIVKHFRLLDFFLELALAGLEYSTNERKLREWKKRQLRLSLGLIKLRPRRHFIRQIYKIV